MGRCEASECTQGCRSRQHGAQITAAIIRGTEAQAIAYMKNLCQRCYSVVDTTGKTALHTAASCGKRKVVKWLVSQGASVNQRDWESGYTSLHRALFYGHLDTACTLIQAGSSISTLDNDALTPLDHVNFDRCRSISFTSSRPTHVYLWGNNTNFNLGQTSQQARGTPECLDSFHREGHKICDVVLNKFHTLFLTTSGRVYTCGHGQGGRLGLDTTAPVITPRPIKAFTHTTVIRVASGTHHSLFLTDAGQVWSCGSNLYHQLGVSPPPEHVYTPRVLTWHKEHKETVITGIDAAKYHSVIWTPHALYTFGLNAGQLGHFRNTNECTIITPRNVTGIVLKEDGNLTCVGVSDGATVLSTSHGTIYVLHQYQIRKVASKMLGVLKVACVGGHLDSKVGTEGLIEHGGDDLKIGVLTGGGGQHLYLWTEQSSHLSCCTFSISREICVTDFCMSSQCLGIVTNNGEAFTGVISPTRMQKGNEKPAVRKSLWSSGNVVDTYYTTSYITLRLTRIPALHRTLSIMCDPKGLNFAALQNEPCCFLSDVPHVSPSTFRKNFKSLLQYVSETDTTHDVVIICGRQRFPAHSYILATHSQYFHRVLLQDATNTNVPARQLAWNIQNEAERKCINLSDVQPEAFQEVLNFIYTGCCKQVFFRNATYHSDNNINDINGNTSGVNEWDSCRNFNKRSASSSNKENEMKVTEKSKKRKGRSTSTGATDLSQAILSLARKLEIPALEKALANYKKAIGTAEESDVHFMTCDDSVTYSRESLPDLWDVTVTSKTGDAVRGHKCILAARLEYFNIMFESRWMGTAASESINMPLPTSILTIILDYLYEDDSPKLKQCHDVEFLCNVLVVADQLLVTRLREKCERIIAGLLTLKNAAELLEFAASYNASGLKTTIMQFLCQNLVAVLENGTLLSAASQEKLQEMSEYYRSVNDCMSYRIITPYDAPPYSQDLQQALDESPFILPESDEEMDCALLFKEEKSLMSRSTHGSARKKKKQRRNSQGEGRHRKASTSSSVGSSDCEQKDLEEEFENMSFDDLEERKQSPVKETTELDIKKEEIVDQSENLLKGRGESGNSLWQKVSRKKSTSVQSVSLQSPVQSPVEENASLDLSLSVTSAPQQNPQDADACSSKIQKLSQKQRKRLISETAKTPPPDKVKAPACPWAPSAPAWGTETGAEDVSNDTSSLAGIMMAEKTRREKSSAPITMQDRKNQAGSIAQSRSRNGGTPNNSYKDQESTAWCAATPAPTPVHSRQQIPNNAKPTNETTTHDFVAPSFTNILMEEETRSDNLIRELSKPLSVIQTRSPHTRPSHTHHTPAQGEMLWRMNHNQYSSRTGVGNLQPAGQIRPAESNSWPVTLLDIYIIIRPATA
ncbi:Inhibitor of Bruton tyrosine kinase [Chionoecetes opilio]|uniref:Inhibitor of Bruton tyrosine kinase n=1 Tax=Chionoecetes opilio TaxID=41210 RepID=A0A8J4XR86_CHIOP|nr:Inhibitor of Bruton tyrosine kinase [Chionoecetes opilio]